MLPDLSAQDELLVAIALADYSRQWKDAEPRNADRAWRMCVEICRSHGLRPSEAVRQLE